MSTRYWRPLAQRLSARGIVYSIDLPGYGAAPNPHRDLSVTDHAEVVAEFLARENLGGAVLVGHSMGCQVVSEVVVRHPGLSDRIVLLGPTLDPKRRTLAASALDLGTDMLREPPRANWIVVTDYLFRCGVPWYLPHLLRDRIEDRMPEVAAETLVVRGKRDPVVSREWGRRVAELAPRGTFREVPGAHVIMFSAPAETAAMIVEHALKEGE